MSTPVLHKGYKVLPPLAKLWRHPQMIATTRGAARFVASRAKRMGYDVSRENSSLSESIYLTCYTDTLNLRIRISNHTARPTYEQLYGVADFEVSVGKTHENQAANGDALDAVSWLAGQLHVETPADVAAVLAGRAREENERINLELAARNAATASRMEWFAKVAASPVLTDLRDKLCAVKKTGQSGRRARNKIRVEIQRLAGQCYL